MIWLGDDPPELSLDCRHASRAYKVRMYDRAVIRQKVTEMNMAEKKQAKNP